MPGCSAGDDKKVFSESEPWRGDIQPKSKSAESAAPLGVLPVQGTLELDYASARARVLLRGGLAGWQKKRVVEFIEQHLHEAISVGALAGIARLSPFHFSRAFKQTFGLPPHRYHMQRRMERAKSLLPKFSVTGVALAVGYGETSSFSAAFRRATGLSPTQFKRRTFL